MPDDRTEAIRDNLRRDYGALIPAGGVQNQMLADLAYLLDRLDRAEEQAAHQLGTFRWFRNAVDDIAERSTINDYVRASLRAYVRRSGEIVPALATNEKAPR